MGICMCVGRRRETDLHVHVLGGQSEIVQVVVSRRVGVGVQTGGEVTAGHGHTHHTVADT